MGLFLNVVGEQYEHVFGLLSDEGANAHAVGGTELEVSRESWDALDEDVRVEIARHLLPGSDVVAAPLVTPDEVSAPSDMGEPAGDRGAGPSRPAMVGRGSGRSAWAEYAEELGVNVTDDMKREDIIQLVEQVEE